VAEAGAADRAAGNPVDQRRRPDRTRACRGGGGVTGGQSAGLFLTPLGGCGSLVVRSEASMSCELASMSREFVNYVAVKRGFPPLRVH